MRMYLGADYSRKPEISGYAATLRSNGCDITSTWHDVDNDNVAGFGIGGAVLNVGDAGLAASRDITDLVKCDMFVLFTTGEVSRGGRHTEYGIALALNKKIVTVGPREHAFHCLLHVDNYKNWDQFLIWYT